ncbi:MAG: S8 family serine peptidase, partial [Candidatus Sericytochromatia bacterium]|nr:S8 family serine peptidase [Candidatus Tanganyikabacteria bacterium]
NGKYKTMSGTSMATPHVAGAAGLLLSARPDLTVAQLRQLLETTGDAVSGFTDTPNVKRLNLAKAFEELEKLGAMPPPAESPADDPPSDPPGPPAAPVISGISIARTSVDSATIRWKTDLPTKGEIEFGEGPDYGGSTSLGSAYKTSHEVAIKGLKRSKTYHFRISATTEAGISASSENKTFKTKTWWIFSLEN